MSKLTRKQLRALKEESGCCPKCGSTNVNFDSYQYEGDTIWQNAVCIDCQLKWQDIYERVGAARGHDGARTQYFNTLHGMEAEDVLLMLTSAMASKLRVEGAILEFASND